MLTTDPAEILESRRLLPAGYWKGSGLAILLDVIAVLLSGGGSTTEISSREAEFSVSQVFIAIDQSKLGNQNSIAPAIKTVVENLHGSILAPNVREVLYPGERVVKTRSENLEKGIPVDRSVWEEVKSL
jgi:3-dehydro-L-gulonate 2-dehydrogenase